MRSMGYWPTVELFFSIDKGNQFEKLDPVKSNAKSSLHLYIAILKGQRPKIHLLQKLQNKRSLPFCQPS